MERLLMDILNAGIALFQNGEEKVKTVLGRIGYNLPGTKRKR
ncbi:hypothetical protein LEP1GSC064_2396 [Leptospira kirschneri serovar Grippotyphosa str. Moskva]|nr:hypothetical protein LEP1GSC064_2396 [Leptospira kirschneri serovar Grippotyphosa str. Moskva]